jgi:ankyrin repeat protein
MGQTALMIACNYHNNEIAKLLIDNGADTESLDDFGFRYLFLCSALMYASKENNIIMTIYLIHIGTRFQV